MDAANQLTNTGTPDAMILREDFKFTDLHLNPTDAALREMAGTSVRETAFKNLSYVSIRKSRMAQFTRTTLDEGFREEDLKVIQSLKDDIKSTPMVQIDRVLGVGENQVHCRLFLQKTHARLGLMFSKSLGEAKGLESKDPDFITIDVPDFNPTQPRIFVDTTSRMTLVMGSDYYGEIKKSFLRQFMYFFKQKGGLGLHAGSKEVWARSEKTGEIKRRGLLFFGLSGTGKTSLTCHDYGIDPTTGESMKIRQDDVVAMTADGFCIGSEPGGFYIKTEGLSPEDQRLLYQACVSPNAMLENVYVAEDGTVDFNNTTISKNGRAIVRRNEIEFTDEEIDMPKGDLIFFITRNRMSAPVARLTPEQGGVAFMLGESIKTSAADPNAKGEPVREVGTNPFIVGDRDEEGNRFYEILKNNPDAQVFLLNTGHVGLGEKARKIKILETTAIIRAICRDAVEWKKDGTLGQEVPTSIPGVSEDLFNFEAHFEKKELQRSLEETRQQRVEWLRQFPQLDQAIISALY